MNDVVLTLQLELKHEAAHNYRVLYDWLTPMEGAGDNFEVQTRESPLLREWHLVQIEGEDPMPDASEVTEIKKPAKGAKKPMQEEITDERPRIVSHRETCELKVSIEAASKLAKTSLEFVIEDEQGSVVETVSVQVCEVLWPKSESHVSVLIATPVTPLCSPSGASLS